MTAYCEEVTVKTPGQQAPPCGRRKFGGKPGKAGTPTKRGESRDTHETGESRDTHK